MAPINRRPLSDKQRFVIGSFIIVGLFILTCGTGMTNIAVGGLGIAVAVLGPLLITVAESRGSSRDFTFGTAHVHSVSPLPETGKVGRCELQLLVNAQGIEGVPVRLKDPAVSIAKWPDVGATLPVIINVRYPRHVRILWDEVSSHRDNELEDNTPEKYPETEARSPSVTATTDSRPPSPWSTKQTTQPPQPLRPSARPRRPRPHHVSVKLSKRHIPTEPEPISEPEPQPEPISDPEPQPEPQSQPEPTSESEPQPEQRHLAQPDSSPPAHGVSVTLMVSDLDRSREFYRDTLGLHEIDAGRSSAVLAFGDARVILRQVSDTPPADLRPANLNLDVSDVYEVYNQLREKGVKFIQEPTVTPHGEHLELCSATFCDPDGHTIAITRWIMRR